MTTPAVFSYPTPPSSNTATTFYLFPPTGFIQLTIVHSTLNPWSSTLQATIRAHVDGAKICESVGMEMKGFVCGDGSVTSKLVDIVAVPTGYKLKYQNGAINLDADVVTKVEGFTIGGKRQTNGDGWVSVNYLAKATMSFTLKKGTKQHVGSGYAFAHNSVQCLPQKILRMNFMTLQNDRTCVFVYEFAWKGGRCSEACVVHDNIVEVFQNKVEFHDSVVDPFSKYAVPTRMTHTLTNEGAEVGVEWGLVRMIDKIDVLGELPYFVRVFIQTFITAPFCYQWLENCKAVVKKGDKTEIIEGWGFQETTFLGDM